MTASPPFTLACGLLPASCPLPHHSWEATKAGNYYALCSVALDHALLSLLEQVAGAWSQRALSEKPPGGSGENAGRAGRAGDCAAAPRQPVQHPQPAVAHPPTRLLWEGCLACRAPLQSITAPLPPRPTPLSAAAKDARVLGHPFWGRFSRGIIDWLVINVVLYLALAAQVGVLGGAGGCFLTSQVVQADTA